MKAIPRLSCITAIVALFSCAKTVVVEEKEKEFTKIPEVVMTLPGQGQVLNSPIWLDPADGHYKSSAFDFGTILTHPTNYVTGQAGVGIHSISGKNGDLISAEIIGDKFIAHLLSFPGGNIPQNSPLYTVRPSVLGFEIDSTLTSAILGIRWYDTSNSVTITVLKINDHYFTLDSARAKAKGIKLKSPLTTTEINGPLYSANSDGIIVYKGRILMDTNSPSGMAIYPYDVTPVHDPYDTTPFNFGTYYPANGSLGSITAISFLSTQSDATRGYGNIIGLFVNFQGTPAVYTGTFRSEPPTGPYQMPKIFVTFHGTLPDGTEVHLDDVEVTPGV